MRVVVIFGNTLSAALFQQHPLGSTKAIKEFQVSRAKIKTTRMTGSFIFRALLALKR